MERDLECFSCGEWLRLKDRRFARTRAAEGLTNQEIARKLGVTGATVGTWRERYRAQGMEGLADEPRPGTPRKITDTKVEGGHANSGESADRSDPLEHPLAGGEGRVEPECRGANLAQFWVGSSPKSVIASEAV
jgi:hypothetical protein